jgi:Mrp family chromosome partitioning ATPase
MQQLGSASWQRGPSMFSENLIPKDVPVNAHPKAPAPVGDEVLRLVQRVFLQTEKRPRVVAFAGVNRGEGCSRICASVAEALSRSASGSVCLVEANFRSPALPAFFHITNHHGLTDSLLSEGPIRSFAKPVASDKKLWLLSSGALGADSANLLSSEKLGARILELRGEFEFVLIDSPPMTPYSDAVTVGSLTDGFVMVLEAESTRREPALAATEALRSAGIPILAAVLNNRIFPIPKSLYRRL